MTREWIQLCLDRTVVRRALQYSVIVGIVLVAINHGDAIIRGEAEARHAIKIALTFLVPYTVSTLSSVGAIRELQST